jgi:GNAT superfamily N-acetyltransferase
VSNHASEWLTPAPGPVIALPRPNQGTGLTIAPVGSLGGGPGRPEIVIATAPSGDDFRTIFRALDDFNAPMVGHARFEPLAVLIRDDVGAVTGGLWGCTVYSWLVINMLFVPEALRRHGIGTILIRAAEDEARSRGCIGMQVDTFGFQAQPFYERLGFTVFGVQPNFPPGHRCVFLRKPFDDA